MGAKIIIKKNNKANGSEERSYINFTKLYNFPIIKMGKNIQVESVKKVTINAVLEKKISRLIYIFIELFYNVKDIYATNQKYSNCSLVT